MLSPTPTDRATLVAIQSERLRELVAEVLPGNPFYARKLAAAGVDATSIRSLDDLCRLPFTTKDELSTDQAACPPYGTNRSFPLERYTRLHQTSGTMGRPLYWLDTPESWQAMLGCWRAIYAVVGLGPGDRLFFPFSFGPFLGLWTAYEAAAQLGLFVAAGGGLSSLARLRFLREHRITTVLCTPTYALRLAEVAQNEHIDLQDLPVRTLIVMGEPGGSVPATRRRIEGAWGARVFDHSGLTEVGPVAIECRDGPGGLHILEEDYVAEVIDPERHTPTPAGDIGELVLTNLRRRASPVFRYRTGDLVRLDTSPCPCGRPWLRLQGGILGRRDDMIQVRGHNVYPAALEQVVHRFPEVAEYRVVVDQTGDQTEVVIEVEPRLGVAAEVAARISQAIRDELLFRAEVVGVPPGTLPRFDMKSRRLVFRRPPMP